MENLLITQMLLCVAYPNGIEPIVYGFGDRCSTIELGAFTKHSRYKSSSSLCATGRIQTYVVSDG